METALSDALREAAGALVFSDVAPGQPIAPGEATLCVVLPLLEPEAGLLVLRLAVPEAAALSQIAWGGARTDDPVQVEQFLLELANVIGGRYLAMAHPDEPVRIGFPERVPPELCPTPSRSAVWDLDGCRLELGTA